MDSSDWLQQVEMEIEATRPATDSSSSPSPGPGDTVDCSQPRRLRPQDDQPVKCPRCDSNRTKFCYYNNYSLSQPRYFCKTCRRYWTKGGTLRNVPVGGGCRKVKKPTTPKNDKRHNINGIDTDNNIDQESPISMGKTSSSTGLADHLRNLPVTFPEVAGVSGLGGLYGSPGDFANLGSAYGFGLVDFAESKFEGGMGEPDGSNGFMMGGFMGSNHHHMGCHYRQHHPEFLNGTSNLSHGLMGSAIGASLNDGTYNMLDARQPLMLPHGEYDQHQQEHNNSSFIGATLIDVKPSNSRLVSLPWQDQGCTSGAGNESYGSGRPLDLHHLAW